MIGGEPSSGTSIANFVERPFLMEGCWPSPPPRAHRAASVGCRAVQRMGGTAGRGRLPGSAPGSRRVRDSRSLRAAARRRAPGRARHACDGVRAGRYHRDLIAAHLFVRRERHRGGSGPALVAAAVVRRHAGGSVTGPRDAASPLPLYPAIVSTTPAPASVEDRRLSADLARALDRAERDEGISGHSLPRLSLKSST